MSEMAKTVLMVVAAVVSLTVGFAFGPSKKTQNFDALIGKQINQFEIDVAKRLKIVKFDRETASTREFEVAERDGLWTIPSKQDYPADAAKQMAEAATCLVDREVLRIASKNSKLHKDLGVIDPNSSGLDAKSEGVGLRATVTDSDDQPLADMIIGNAVKDAEGQYYVRNAEEDVVMVVNLDPSKLSTKFEDWIEDDLLQLNPRDISRVDIKDYSLEINIGLTQQGFVRQAEWDRRGKFLLSYDEGESEWSPEQLQLFDAEADKLTEYQLAENEELNEETLKELRSSLDDLLLVDVERKPKGLSADLKAGSDFLDNEEALTSLGDRGFVPLSLNGASPEILSSEGELICTLKDGVEYVLRFGNLQVGEVDGESATPAEEADAGDAIESKANDGINRYLFVSVRFNESAVEEPTLTELPALPEGTAEESNDESEAPENSEGDQTDSEAEKEEGTTEETEESESEDTSSETSAEDEAAEEVEQSEEDELAKLIAERKEIEKENQRLLDEYQESLQAGKDRVQELNERFGDWYYVISNDFYKKIHLGRDEIITQKKNEDAAGDTAKPVGGGIPGLPNLPVSGGK